MSKSVGEIFSAIEDDLSWKGPTGKKLGHVVIPRDDMLMLLKWIKYSVRPEHVHEMMFESYKSKGSSQGT